MEMDYTQALEYILSLVPRGIHLGLTRMRALCSAIGNPQRKLKFVHVAGTNGKGSTCAMLSNVLTEAGYTTGLFISPAVVDYREALQVNGEMIRRAAFSRLVPEIKAGVESLAGRGMFVTEFEALTAMAFLHFERSGCDIVVLEVGLGGREDATNVIDGSLVSVIASIALDHMDFLGGTIDKIACEKCGIIKPNGVTVIYPEQDSAARLVIEESVRLNEGALIVPDLAKLQLTHTGIEGSAFRYGAMEFTTRLIGEHMVKNALVAIEAAKALKTKGYTINDSALQRGIHSTVMPARMELFSRNPIVILDGGHNEGCALALREAIRISLTDKKIIAVCAMMSNKDYVSYLKILAPHISFLIATGVPTERSLPATTLYNAALDCEIHAQCTEDCVEAVQRARAMAGPKDAILVCGSFFLAGPVRKYLEAF